MKKKIFIIVILIFLLVILINFCRNYLILKKLQEKIKTLSLTENYSYTLEQNSTIQKITKSNDIIKVEDNEKILYFNTKTNEAVRENINSKERIYYSGPVPTSVNLELLDLDKYFSEALLKNIIITTSKVKNEKCYKVKIPSLNLTYYINENGLTYSLKYNDSKEQVSYYDYQLDNIPSIDFESLKLNN